MCVCVCVCVCFHGSDGQFWLLLCEVSTVLENSGQKPFLHEVPFFIFLAHFAISNQFLYFIYTLLFKFGLERFVVLFACF